MTAVHEQAATDPDGPTGSLATWVADLTLDAVPQNVVERAKHLLLDGLGCALVGAQLPWSRVATDAVLGLEGTGDTVVIGTGHTTSAPAAAVLNGTFIQGFELDDFHPLAPLHSCSLLIPALLSTASVRPETTGPVRGAELLLAAIAGFEVGPRVGYTLHGTQMLDRGWHSGSVFGTHAAAMASGKLRGLPPAQLEDALGLAGTQSAGLMAAQYEAMSKRMHHGLAARNGFYAAGLAAAGYTGIKRVFEREYGGFLSVFGEGHDPDASLLTGQLGQRWETTIIMVKSLRRDGRPARSDRRRQATAEFGCTRGYLEDRHHRRRDRVQARLVAAGAATHPDRRPDEHRVRDRRGAARRQRAARAVHPRPARLRRHLVADRGNDGAPRRIAGRTPTSPSGSAPTSR